MAPNHNDAIADREKMKTAAHVNVVNTIKMRIDFLNFVTVGKIFSANSCHSLTSKSDSVSGIR